MKTPGDICHDAFLASVNNPTKTAAQAWEDVYTAALAIPPRDMTLEERERANFDKWREFYGDHRPSLFDVWLAARAWKEDAKS